jgi:regulator of protease activity HflC (stomatin/prohibitin superfamily)
MFNRLVFKDGPWCKGAGIGVAATGAGALLLTSLFCSITTVSTGNIGVIRTFGKVDTANLLAEGFHFIAPWQSVFTLDNRTTKTSLEKPAEAASHDMQSVHTNIAVNWRINPSKVGTVLQQFGVSGDGGGEALTDKVVVPAILETFKSVISQYTAEELVTKRVEVSNRITDYLAKKMAQYDLIVETSNITNFAFSPQFNAAIEAKVTATQSSLKAEQDLKRIKIEAEQRIAQAEGEAKAIHIQASAIKAQGGAEYVQLQAIHKWNGVLPQTVLGDKSVPFVSVSK